MRYTHDFPLVPVREHGARSQEENTPGLPTAEKMCITMSINAESMDSNDFRNVGEWKEEGDDRARYHTASSDVGGTWNHSGPRSV